MPAVDRNVLRIGVYELLYVEDVPDAVAVTEAIALVRDLSTDESPPSSTASSARCCATRSSSPTPAADRARAWRWPRRGYLISGMRRPAAPRPSGPAGVSTTATRSTRAIRFGLVGLRRRPRAGRLAGPPAGLRRAGPTPPARGRCTPWRGSRSARCWSGPSRSACSSWSLWRLLEALHRAPRRGRRHPPAQAAVLGAAGGRLRLAGRLGGPDRRRRVVLVEGPRRRPRG